MDQLLEPKANAATAFKHFLADVRAGGFPSEMQVVMFDSGLKIETTCT